MFTSVVSILGTGIIAIVSEKGIEGVPAVFGCSYPAEYKTFPKSFCKERNTECETLLQTDSQNDWKIEGRLSLHDNKEKHMFVVTIKNLSLEDEGRYGCGVRNPEIYLFTVVDLSVMNGFVGVSFYVGAFFGAVLLLSSIFCVFKRRVMKGSAGTTENMKDVCVYDEIQHGNPAEQNTSETPEVPPGPDSYPVCITVYSTLTNQKEAAKLTDILQTNRESCGIKESSDPADNKTKPKNCLVEFPDAQDVCLSRGCDVEYSTVSNQNPIYSLVVAPKTKINSAPGTSAAIILSVFVVLILFAVVLYMFIKWRRNKRDHTSSSNTDQLNNRQLEHTADDYEEIKDYNIRHNIHTIYKNTKLPVNSSDSPAGLEHTAEDVDEINNTEPYSELCEDATMAEAPTGSLDSPTDLTQSHEYNEVNFLPNSQCFEHEFASSFAIKEMNE
ncbi:CMRF35-like molecule 9 [Bagarius yarrelli]|uniref:CMRF35-like molecule 9 n=1 Tax=Bagarius yarrelli TaxID=175774 RepID=A0A556TL85_BAGYA|nr:CMRF35-like molecule 9 [Bagarius yarrelli]